MKIGKYSLATIAKALAGFGVAFVGAATAAAGGPDLSVLDLSQWIGALGTGLVGFAAVFATPNKSTDVALSPADQVINNLPVVVQNVSEAAAELDRVKQAATDVLGDVPILGPLANAIINGRR